MSVRHFAATYDDVLAWNVGTQSVGISSRLQSYAVVSGVEGASFNQYVLARFRVTSVAVGAFVEYRDVSDGEVLYEQRMNHPEGRIAQFHVLNHRILTSDEID